jgi:hypothetical protein
VILNILKLFNLVLVGGEAFSLHTKRFLKYKSYGASLSANDPTLCRSSIGIRTRRSPSGIEGSASCSFEETCSREDTAQHY